MVAGENLVHGMIAQYLVVVQNTVDYVHVIILPRNMGVMIARLTDPLIPRQKDAMKIHAQVK